MKDYVQSAGTQLLGFMKDRYTIGINGLLNAKHK